LPSAPALQQLAAHQALERLAAPISQRKSDRSGKLAGRPGPCRIDAAIPNLLVCAELQPIGAGKVAHAGASGTSFGRVDYQGSGERPLAQHREISGDLAPD